ncbi:hypothetical protein N7532_004225 [Penicillium argentinense]|uniref:HRDC domain-containing protein n=1 Tax=Penicillium argentinense TaxID=1131581 RepID=A0A9W9KFB1_9EURO|nr:uncharacterized protein N7532_004225 [Penicillium argentinense]KAJ5103696.1 hypothetical protein N7532_004225 [Penicillium argentinense]
MESAEFPQFQEKLSSNLVQVTRTVGQLAAEDLNFQRTSGADFADSLDEQSDRILTLVSAVLKAATAGSDLANPALPNEDSLEDNWRGVVDVIDSLLEKTDACLDEFTGVIKRLSPSHEEQPAAPKKESKFFPSIYDNGPSKIPKPQLKFPRKPDNSGQTPFYPLLQTKPNARIPLDQTLSNPKKFDGKLGWPHPYEDEIRASQYPKRTYETSPPVDYLPFDTTTATFVDSVDGVKAMLSELKAAKEIAVDLEHHDVHSYHGLVSLMQISTREKDWVVDTLQPWREELQMLNEVFTDPKILKVFHGAAMDIVWLQRDLGLYVVGLFDTFHAASALGYPKRSLKILLQKFVNFEADKRYQTADWRIRPLTDEMFNYARSDTHYLLYIYDCLRNELIASSEPNNSLVDYVLEHSKNEALQRYERPVYDAEKGQGPGGWYDLLSRNAGVLSKEQFAVFKAIHQWRDEVAREEDEGWQCVFPKAILFKVAYTMPLDIGSLYRTLAPVTPLTKARAGSLLETIKAAKAAGVNGPEWRDVPAPPRRPRALPVNTEDVAVPNAGRLETSQFWGNTLGVQEQRAPLSHALVAAAEALRISIPLPRMPAAASDTREKFGAAPFPPAASVTAAPASAPAPALAPTPAPAPKAEEEKNVFTVKELGGPRKRKVTPVESSAPAASAADDYEEKLREKKEHKKARKEEKKAAKAAAKTQAAEAVPFDYNAATSVLNAPSTAVPGASKPTKAFNPYAKALEAPSGVRKQKKEIPGKSLTFRD